MRYSASRLKSFQQCSRKFYNHYIEGYSPIGEKPWLKIGSDIDDLLAIYDVQGYDAMMEELPKRFEDEYEYIKFEELLKYYNKNAKHKLSPIEFDGKPGNQWYFDLPITAGYCEADIRLQGYLDKISTYEGRVCVVERKTTSECITYRSDYWATIPFDKQITGYCWALSEVMGGHVGLVFYEVLRKPKAPIKHTVKGKQVLWSLDDYREQVQKALARSPHLAQRKFWISRDAIEDFKADVISIDDQISISKLNQTEFENHGLPKSYAWARNQAGCSAFGGCEYLDVCSGHATLESCQTITKKEK